MSTYMIIETFHPGKVKALYQRFDEQGRLLPEGVTFVQSWIDEEVTQCFQVMESDSLDKLIEWAERWNDLADFEIIPVLDSKSARAKMLGE